MREAYDIINNINHVLHILIVFPHFKQTFSLCGRNNFSYIDVDKYDIDFSKNSKKYLKNNFKNKQHSFKTRGRGATILKSMCKRQGKLFSECYI